MHIVHVTVACHALTTGGTERYILELIRGMDEMHQMSDQAIAWIWDHSQRRDTEFFSDGVRILPLHTKSARVDEVEAGFEGLVEQFLRGDSRPDLLHFHTFGMAEAAVAAVASKHGIPYIFTYHSPAWSCRRGTLLRWGHSVCDGQVGPLRCSACKLQERLGGHPVLGWLGALLSLPLGLFGRFVGGKLHRRTAFVEDTWRFGRAFRKFLAGASRVVSCCEWSHPVLQCNGAQRERLAHCPQGVPMSFVSAAGRGTGGGDERIGGPRSPFTVGYVGRLTADKGIHLLVEAFCRTKYPDARLHVYGWSPNRSTGSYAAQVEKVACGDPRVRFFGKLPFEAMMAEYHKLDLLAIPSVWLETGPLTLLEALQLGVAVWGSENIGQMGVLKAAGKVIEPNTAEAWQAALEEAFEVHRSGAWEGPGPQKVRTMSNVSHEMYSMYAQILE